MLRRHAEAAVTILTYRRRSTSPPKSARLDKSDCGCLQRIGGGRIRGQKKREGGHGLSDRLGCHGAMVGVVGDTTGFSCDMAPTAWAPPDGNVHNCKARISPTDPVGRDALRIALRIAKTGEFPLFHMRVSGQTNVGTDPKRIILHRITGGLRIGTSGSPGNPRDLICGRWRKALEAVRLVGCDQFGPSPWPQPIPVDEDPVGKGACLLSSVRQIFLQAGPGIVSRGRWSSRLPGCKRPGPNDGT